MKKKTENKAIIHLESAGEGMIVQVMGAPKDLILMLTGVLLADERFEDLLRASLAICEPMKKHKEKLIKKRDVSEEEFNGN